MKRTTKTLMAILLMITGSIAFTACQEDVYPELNHPEVLGSSSIESQESTGDTGEDEGVDPK